MSMGAIILVLSALGCFFGARKAGAAPLRTYALLASARRPTGDRVSSAAMASARQGVSGPFITAPTATDASELAAIRESVNPV